MADTQVQQKIADRATRLVEDSPARTMLGSKLGLEIRKSAPEGHGGLAERKVLQQFGLARLLDRYAPELAVVGRKGSDFVWGFERPDDAPDLDIDDILVVESELELLSTQGRPPEGVELLSVAFTNYRSLRQVQVELSALTVLVGANGAGKSNVLDGLFRGVRLAGSKPAIVFGGSHTLDRVVTLGQSDGLAIEVLGSKEWMYTFRSSSPDGLSFEAYAGTAVADQVSSLALTSMKKAFGPVVYLKLSAPALAQATASDEEAPYLRSNGRYLPSVLADLGASDRERLERIVQAVRQVIPQVEDVRTPRRLLSSRLTEVLRIDGEEVRREGSQTKWGNALEVKMHGSWIPADQLSEGTLLVLGLHTILSRSVPPKLLLLDDVDRGLHPNAQMALMKQLISIAQDGVQIVCTSHSPFVLDPLPADCIRVVQMDDSGATHIRKLVDHPDWVRMGDAMNAAEFWLYAGDEWSA